MILNSFHDFFEWLYVSACLYLCYACLVLKELFGVRGKDQGVSGIQKDLYAHLSFSSLLPIQ